MFSLWIAVMFHQNNQRQLSSPNGIISHLHCIIHLHSITQFITQSLFYHTLYSTYEFLSSLHTYVNWANPSKTKITSMSSIRCIWLWLLVGVLATTSHTRMLRPILILNHITYYYSFHDLSAISKYYIYIYIFHSATVRVISVVPQGSVLGVWTNFVYYYNNDVCDNIVGNGNTIYTSISY